MDSNHPSDGLLRVAVPLSFRACDDGILVFDETRNKTCLLNPQAAQVLQLCSQQGVRESVMKVASGMDSEHRATEFESLLTSLQEAGLIVR